MNCVFCSIIGENSPHHEIIWQDDGHIVFVPNEPNRLGHILVVPKKHISYAFDMPPEEYAALQVMSRAVAVRLKKVTPGERIALIIDGMSVPHVHVHLMPVDMSGDFCVPKVKEGETTDALLASMGETLRAGFAGFVPEQEV